MKRVWAVYIVASAGNRATRTDVFVALNKDQAVRLAGSKRRWASSFTVWTLPDYRKAVAAEAKRLDAMRAVLTLADDTKAEYLP